MDRDFMARVEKALQDIWLSKNKNLLNIPLDQNFAVNQAALIGYLKCLIDVQTVFIDQSKIQEDKVEEPAPENNYNV